MLKAYYMKNLQYVHVTLLMDPSVILYHLTFLFVEPADAAAVVMRLEEQLSEELPQVDGLARVVTHHIWPGIIVSCWEVFRNQMFVVFNQ